MKKIYAIIIACLAAGTSQGQEVLTRSTTTPAISTSDRGNDLSRNVAARGSAFGDDTLYLRNTYQANGPYSNINFDYAAPFDSGKLYGMNVLGLKGFAQLYRFSSIDAVAPVDTLYKIIGVVSRFSGTKSPNSTKSITVSVWKRDAVKYPVSGRSKFYMYGMPQAATTASQNVPFSAITTGASTLSYFATPLNGINYDVYVGYTINYSWNNLGGDTIGLASTQTSGSNTYTLESGTGDTLVAVRNLVQLPTGTWKSIVYDYGIGNGGDQVIYPIVKFQSPTGIEGVVRNNLTFFGNYPNPAVNSTNLRFSIKNKADVTIEVIDATGRTVSTINQAGLATGTHTINISTADLAAGNYVYVVRTSEGDGIASQFAVVK